MDLSTTEKVIEHCKQMEKQRLSPEGILKHKRDTAILIYSLSEGIKYDQAHELFDKMRW